MRISFSFLIKKIFRVVFFLNFVFVLNRFMKLEIYISDLLYRYDLVVVPNFGGIIGRKKSARYDRNSYIFSPPHKELSFNRQLIENDGLLERYVADSLHISNEEALENITQAVNEWKSKLQEYKSINLQQIGVFKLVDQDRLIFLPLTTKNYLSDAYGLNSFVHKPLAINVLTEQQKHVKKEPVGLTQISRKKASKDKSSYTYLWKYAAIFVVGVGLFGGVAKWYPKSSDNQETFQKASFVFKQDFPAINVTSENQHSNKRINIVENKQFYIIGGAFRSKKNALKKVLELKKMGYQSEIIGKNKYNLYMVSYGNFADTKTAHKELKIIKKTQASAWFFEK